MQQYLDLLRRISKEGEPKGDRTGTGTLSLFGPQLEFDLRDGFPLVTTKKVFLRGIIIELLWFLRGETNVRWLQEHDVHIWDDWAEPETGELGPVYGKQWRAWRTADGRVIDQIHWVVNRIKTNPTCRRLIVSAWNVGEIGFMRLPPCHLLFQFHVSTDGRLSCKVYQRSADFFLGVPFNIASYALLTMMMAQVTDLTPGRLILTFGDAHIYHNHFRQVDLQLSREPYPLPTMKFDSSVTDIDDFSPEHFELVGYQCHPGIKAPIAV